MKVASITVMATTHGLMGRTFAATGETEKVGSSVVDATANLPLRYGGIDEERGHSASLFSVAKANQRHQRVSSCPGI
jgi:hypothetical protein